MGKREGGAIVCHYVKNATEMSHDYVTMCCWRCRTCISKVIDTQRFTSGEILQQIILCPYKLPSVIFDPPSTWCPMHTPYPDHDATPPLPPQPLLVSPFPLRLRLSNAEHQLSTLCCCAASQPIPSASRPACMYMSCTCHVHVDDV